MGSLLESSLNTRDLGGYVSADGKKILMSKLEVVYTNCKDIKFFANRMYSLWERLPENIQNIEPFKVLCMLR